MKKQSKRRHKAPLDIACIDLVYDMLTRYLDLKNHEFVAITLWILHTHVYERFMHTPRLTLLSPVPDCGKTTVLSILEKLVARPEKSEHTTPAAIYYLLEQGSRTFLLDEMDNAELLRNGTLRSVLNSGYQHGGAVRRVIKGRAKRLPTFAPMALAAINTHQPLHWALLSRSIIINMQRSRKDLQRFDRNDTENLDVVRGQVWLWARPDLMLNSDPEMSALRVGRPRDKWRPLIAIADAFGQALHSRPQVKQWGELAREAAITFAHARRDQDLPILLLENIREVFAELDADRLFSKQLVESLHKMDAGWDELPLTQAKLANMLSPFNIAPKSIWTKTRTRRSGKGYYRQHFETAWATYCDDEAPPQRDSKIRYLRHG
jgi:Protein of unknown function (DUF3631)